MIHEPNPAGIAGDATVDPLHGQPVQLVERDGVR